MNPDAALSAGVNPKRMVLITLFMSGAVAGMIGLPFLLSDPSFLKYGDAFPTMIGFTGLGIALLGRNHPVGIGGGRDRLGDDRTGDAAARTDSAIPPRSARSSRARSCSPRSSPTRSSVAATTPPRVAAAAATTRDDGRTATRSDTGRCADRSPVMTATIDSAPPRRAERPSFLHSARFRIVAIVMIGIGVMSAARIIADNPDLTSSGTFGAGLRTAAPIALAGLGGTRRRTQRHRQHRPRGNDGDGHHLRRMVGMGVRPVDGAARRHRRRHARRRS